MFNFISMNWRGRPPRHLPHHRRAHRRHLYPHRIAHPGQENLTYYETGIKVTTKSWHRSRSPARVPRRLELHHRAIRLSVSP